MYDAPEQAEEFEEDTQAEKLQMDEQAQYNWAVVQDNAQQLVLSTLRLQGNVTELGKPAAFGNVTGFHSFVVRCRVVAQRPHLENRKYLEIQKYLDIINKK